MPLSESAPTLLRFRLHGRVGGVERSWPVLSGRNRVGRDLTNELVVDEKGVSRHHATVWLEAGRLVVTDAKSKNGTFLNGQPIVRAEIGAGDVVAFGPVDLLCEEVPCEESGLAVDFAAAGLALDASRQTRTSTARSIASQRGSWLALGRSFSSTLRKTGEAAEALATLAATLRLRGAAILSRSQAEPPLPLARSGEIEAAEVEAVAAAWATGGRSFALVGDLCGYAPVDASYPWCLILAGDFHRRVESSELLALLVESYASWQASRTSEATPSSPQKRVGNTLPKLRFPADYVPGSTAAMRSIYDQMQPLVLGDQPVLVVGETGVGKEPIARTLHLSSPRCEAPLLAINCAAVPKDLLEAEFFGIGDRVATGVAGRPGLFRRAAGGTLLLDEVGTMALDLQAKLLRVLQEREIFPIGSSTPVAIDVRIIAMTNADLQTEIDSGRFRRDLYYRLAGYELHLPPLRDRREDIPSLVEHFLRRSCEEIGRPIRGLTASAMHRLAARPWRGNVRQLEHEVRALVYRCPAGGIIDQDMLRQPLTDDQPPAASIDAPKAPAPSISEAPGGPSPQPGVDAPALALDALEKAAVEEALRRSLGNQRRAAELLGITRSSLRRRLKRYDLR